MKYARLLKDNFSFKKGKIIEIRGVGRLGRYECKIDSLVYCFDDTDLEFINGRIPTKENPPNIGDKVLVLNKTIMSSLSEIKEDENIDILHTIQTVKTVKDNVVTLDFNTYYAFNFSDILILDKGEKQMRKYDLLTEISMKKIYEAQGDKNCREFNKDFSHFIASWSGRYEFNEYIDFYLHEKEITDNKIWKKFLIDHNFLRENIENRFELAITHSVTGDTAYISDTITGDKLLNIAVKTKRLWINRDKFTEINNKWV